MGSGVSVGMVAESNDHPSSVAPRTAATEYLQQQQLAPNGSSVLDDAQVEAIRALGQDRIPSPGHASLMSSLCDDDEPAFQRSLLDHPHSSNPKNDFIGIADFGDDPYGEFDEGAGEDDDDGGGFFVGICESNDALDSRSTNPHVSAGSSMNVSKLGFQMHASTGSHSLSTSFSGVAGNGKSVNSNTSGFQGFDPQRKRRVKKTSTSSKPPGAAKMSMSSGAELNPLGSMTGSHLQSASTNQSWSASSHDQNSVVRARNDFRELIDVDKPPPVNFMSLRGLAAESD